MPDKERLVLSTLKRDVGTRVYPYGDTFTYYFLKAAISEGAHLRVPDRIRRHSEGEDYWVRMRNITGVYFTSPATSVDIGKAYGISDKRVRDVTRNFMRHLWNNCSEDLRRKFPYSLIKTAKNGAGKEKTNNRLRHLVDYIESGKTSYQISKETGISRRKLVDQIKSLGIREDLISESDLFKMKMKEASGDLDQKKSLLASRSRNFVEGNSDLLVSSSSIFRKAGRVRRQNSSRSIVKFFDGLDVATVTVENSRGNKMVYVYRPDLVRWAKRIKTTSPS